MVMSSHNQVLLAAGFELKPPHIEWVMPEDPSGEEAKQKLQILREAQTLLRETQSNSDKPEPKPMVGPS